jgi:hypothetical protein
MTKHKLLERIAWTDRLIWAGDGAYYLSHEDADTLMEMLDRLELAEAVCQAAGEVPLSMNLGICWDVCVGCKELVTRAHAPGCEAVRLQTALDAWGCDNYSARQAVAKVLT